MAITEFPEGQTVHTRLSSFTDLWSCPVIAAYPLKGVKMHFTFTHGIPDRGQLLGWLPDFFIIFFALKSDKHLWYRPTFSYSFIFSLTVNEKKL